MRKLLFIVFFILLPINHSLGNEIENKPGQLIRVGVFANPPVAFKNNDGKWSYRDYRYNHLDLFAEMNTKVINREKQS